MGWTESQILEPFEYYNQEDAMNISYCIVWYRMLWYPMVWYRMVWYRIV